MGLKVFVTSTGTDVGKTYVSAALLRAARQRGWSVSASKTVASGLDLTDPESWGRCDAAQLLLAMGRPVTPKNVAELSPIALKAPLSPDQAAAREGRSIAVADLTPPPLADLTLVEGVGGLMVPLNHQHTVLDWIDALRFPILLVVGSYLGTLSHTLTAARVLQDRRFGVVVNRSEHEPGPIEETLTSLRHFLGTTPQAVMQRGGDGEAALDLVAKLNG